MSLAQTVSLIAVREARLDLLCKTDFDARERHWLIPLLEWAEDILRAAGDDDPLERLGQYDALERDVEDAYCRTEDEHDERITDRLEELRDQLDCTRAALDDVRTKLDEAKQIIEKLRRLLESHAPL